MRYGVAIWNFAEEGVPLARLVEEFAEFGFDAASFLPGQLTGCSDGEAAELSALMRERDLAMTVHGNFAMTREDVAVLVERFGGRLLALTFDAVTTWDSRGHLFDLPRMTPLLGAVAEATRETGIRFGVEDFPLDARALEHYREGLAPVLGCPRYGMLIDLGHLNLRRRQSDYFRGLSAAEYVRRAPVPVIEIHVHDNRGEKDDHAPIGFGDNDFEGIAAGLRAIGFDGVSTIEIAPSFHGSTPAQSKPRARESLDLWRRLWER